MKKLLPVLLIIVCHLSVKAQTWDEWFKQKKTQKKYLLEQIAALQVYIGFVQKGYAVARNGLTMISDIKNGDFNLHNQFFNSLKVVQPNIRKDATVAAITDLQLKIAQTCHRANKQVEQSGAFSSGEVNYISRVYSKLMEDCTAVTDALLTVTTANNLEMKDDERLQRISKLYNEMEDQYTFGQNFSSGTMLLAAARMKEKNDVQTSRSMNGIFPTP